MLQPIRANSTIKMYGDNAQVSSFFGSLSHLVCTPEADDGAVRIMSDRQKVVSLTHDMSRARGV